MRQNSRTSGFGSPGFTLVEMILVVFLLAIAMLGILSVFDASARINKSEQDIADAQGAVRYGIYSMTRAIRMAGSGGLPVAQAVLNHNNPDLGGISVTNGADPNAYDNVGQGTTVTTLTDSAVPVRPGTDMIEIRGVINSPLLGFDLTTGCEPCGTEGCSPCNAGDQAIKVVDRTANQHVNDDTANRPQFSQIDDYTAGASPTNQMLVLVAFNDEIHPGCAIPVGVLQYPLYPQPSYSVGTLKARTTLVSAGTFGTVDFQDATIAQKFNPELPGGVALPQPLKNIRHAGILDDFIFFIDNTNPLHPSLAQGTRRGGKFDVVTLADDVEDMQVAYGADVNVDNSIEPEEWSPDTPDKTPYATADFRDAVNGCPRLHGVMISLVAKSHDPDPTYRVGPARVYPLMNSPVSPDPPGYPITAQYPGFDAARFRRRVQTLRINLRNYAYEGG